MSTRALLTLLVGALAVGALIGAQVCPPPPAHGQMPLTPRTLTQYDHVQVAYGRQVERIWLILYEGYLTRPGHEAEEDIKFMRALRTARIAREKAQALIFKEPWEVVTPIPE